MKCIACLSDLRVGAYVDGLNVYHGGRHLCGRDAPSWRWFDLAASVERMISRNAAWTAKGATLQRLVYCTALIRGEIDPYGRHCQEVYLAALRADGRITIESGHFSLRTVRGQAGQDGVRETRKVPNEKGSDVNVASHLLIDIHAEVIDAAVLISKPEVRGGLAALVVEDLAVHQAAAVVEGAVQVAVAHLGAGRGGVAAAVAPPAAAGGDGRQLLDVHVDQPARAFAHIALRLRAGAVAAVQALQSPSSINPTIARRAATVSSALRCCVICAMSPPCEP